ncbi:MAG: DNA primase [Planctomycetia bacterium]|nr:DNA primase [Planctomycetia bacterium]
MGPAGQQVAGDSGIARHLDRGSPGQPRIIPVAHASLQRSTHGQSDDLKERVRDAVDIVDLVGTYISLRRAGKAMVGLCPWHEDSRPSFHVNPERQTFRCWVCNIGGDVFSFLMRMEKLEFLEALEQLATRAGIEFSRGRAGLPPDEKTSLSRAVAWAAERFHACLMTAADAEPARSYLHSRGLTPATIERFRLGYAPASWDWLLRQAPAAGIAAAHLARAGLAVERQERSGQAGGGHYDRFRDRVMFPINDPLSRCVAFGGRVLPGANPDIAKYINSPETPLFSKSSMLYGLDTARAEMSRSRRAIVVEGYTDCLAARQAGIDDVVAVLGTALGERHARLLRRYADRIVLVLDGDAAGRRRADEILDVLLAEPIDVRIARLPAGVDPCEFVLEQGREAFEAVVASAGDPLEYRMDEAVARLAGRSGDDAVLQAVESVLAALANVSPRSPVSPSQRRLREDQVLGRLSRRFGLSRDVLRSRMHDLRGRAAEPAAVETLPAPRLPAWDREVLEVLVGVPDSAGLIVREVESAGMESQEGRAVLEVARRLVERGTPVALSGLLMEITDPVLQSLLVAVDESGADRGLADAGERMHHFAEALRRRSAGRQAQASATTLKTSRLDAGSEAALLEQLVAQRRAAQGMTDPKDG